MKRGLLIGLLSLICFKAEFASAKDLAGKVSIDGSSTVYPITEAIAEEFQQEYPKIRVNIGVSGTGGGFKKFIAGEIDINDASRPIKSSEVADAKKKSLEYIEIPIAYDGLTVVINKENTWATQLTPDQLKKIWDRDSKVKTWKDVDPTWPDRVIKLYGPGTDSGTFDYFTEAINGKSGQCRSDFQKSEDDNVIVNGVSGDKDALGYFGYAYYKENAKQVTAVAIKNSKGQFILPNTDSIRDGSYAPLSRPVFLYVSKPSLERKEIKAFLNYYLSNVEAISNDVGFVAMPKDNYTKELAKLK
jgi:phosphate transport system substrate-binding protein